MISKVSFAAVIAVYCILPIQQSFAANEDLKTAGDVTVVLLPSIAYATTFYLDDEDGRMQLYKSFFSNLAITEVLKQSVQRERPNKVDHKSFPSGHTSVSFQSATFIYQRYGWKPAIPAYIAATFVGYSRVETKWHYTTDVLAGALIGAGTAYYFTEPYHGFQVTPVAESGTYGIALSKEW